MHSCSKRIGSTPKYQFDKKIEPIQTWKAVLNSSPGQAWWMVKHVIKSAIQDFIRGCINTELIHKVSILSLQNGELKARLEFYKRSRASLSGHNQRYRMIIDQCPRCREKQNNV